MSSMSAMSATLCNGDLVHIFTYSGNQARLVCRAWRHIYDENIVRKRRDAMGRRLRTSVLCRSPRAVVTLLRALAMWSTPAFCRSLDIVFEPPSEAPSRAIYSELWQCFRISQERDMVFGIARESCAERNSRGFAPARPTGGQNRALRDSGATLRVAREGLHSVTWRRGGRDAIPEEWGRLFRNATESRVTVFDNKSTLVTEGVRRADLVFAHVARLEGLAMPSVQFDRCMAGMTHMRVVSSELRDASVFAHVRKLELDHCVMIEDVRPLCNVRSLSLRGCVLVRDVSALARLHTLILDETLVEDVSMLGGLVRISLANCVRVRNVDALGRLYALNLAACAGIEDVSALANVCRLSLRGCHGVTLKSAALLTGVERLDLSRCAHLWPLLDTLPGAFRDTAPWTRPRTNVWSGA